MTPTIGRIVHVGYELPNVQNELDLPCRPAIVSGDVVRSSPSTVVGMLPVTVFTPNRPPAAAYVDEHTGWHDPRSCPRVQAVGANDGERVGA